jgi:hypothetical protein
LICLSKLFFTLQATSNTPSRPLLSGFQAPNLRYTVTVRLAIDILWFTEDSLVLTFIVEHRHTDRHSYLFPADLIKAFLLFLGCHSFMVQNLSSCAVKLIYSYTSILTKTSRQLFDHHFQRIYQESTYCCLKSIFRGKYNNINEVFVGLAPDHAHTRKCGFSPQTEDYRRKGKYREETGFVMR